MRSPTARFGSAPTSAEFLVLALRGGGNFGVVTGFEYRLHPLLDRRGHGVSREVLGSTVRCSSPRRIPTAAAAILTGTDGHKACAIAVRVCGPIEEGQKAVRAIKEFARQ